MTENLSSGRQCQYSHSQALLISRILETRLRDRQRSFPAFPCIHYSPQISGSAPLPTVQGWEGLLCNRCLILGSLSNVLSKLLKVGLLSGSNAQQTVKVSCKKRAKFVKPIDHCKTACRECTIEAGKMKQSESPAGLKHTGWVL